ncbi:hypothetical protein QKW45_11555 [Streptomyces sp. AJ-1]|uniref:hypothetical protein n=1 Tax=Streptomyces sp. AJ-1 TaxID=3044384 RepID=UPI00249ACF92|nr:hypothetical protein [Streptomyces sp. AJ-1]MDI3344360.1 hypothetical protein [Streptomyces sp. AJ-1]
MSTPIYSVRGARQMDAATVAKAQAEADLLKAQATAQAEQAKAETERARRQAAAEARRQAEEERERRRERRAAKRRQARARWRVAMNERRELLVTVAVITLFVAVALPAQIDFLATKWVWPMAAAGGVSLESLTWMFAIQGQRRERRGLSARVHRTGTWTAATVAAGINLGHGADMWGWGFAVVAALGSLAAPVAYETYRLSLSEDEHGRTPEEIRQAFARRRHHRKVHRLSIRLQSATVPPMPMEQAWEMAWRMVHAAEPGITQRWLKRHNKRAEKVATLATARDDSTPMPSLAMFAPASPQPVREERTGRTAAEPAERTAAGEERTEAEKDRTEKRTDAANAQATRRTPAVQGARTLARETARRAYDDAEMEQLRQRAQQAYAESLDAGRPIGPAALAKEFGFSEGWGRKRIKAVEAERAASRQLHLVAASGDA